jgi:coatomer subunit epsilon
MKGLVASNDGIASVALFASQLFFSHGMTKDALQCVHLGATLEHMSMALQIYLKLDRLDLAQAQLESMRSTDEDAVLTSLGAVHIALAGGSSTASDAAHTLSSLSEQYGPSPLLLNLSACAYCMTGDYDEAEAKLLDCQREFSQSPAYSDTLINLIVVSQYLDKPYASYLLDLQKLFPAHPFLASLERVEGAFAREALKYKVAAS